MERLGEVMEADLPNPREIPVESRVRLTEADAIVVAILLVMIGLAVVLIGAFSGA